MAPKVKTAAPAVTTSLGPQIKEGELVFGVSFRLPQYRPYRGAELTHRSAQVAHIFASFNDTFVHVTDLSGKETIARVTGKYAQSLPISPHSLGAVRQVE